MLIFPPSPPGERRIKNHAFYFFYFIRKIENKKAPTPPSPLSHFYDRKNVRDNGLTPTPPSASWRRRIGRSQFFGYAEELTKNNNLVEYE